ncbi:hypothetical protein [Salibacterium sp. K-3]
MNITEASYIAGIIDGEGTITLTRWHKTDPFRRPVITISSTDKELLLYLKSIVGGVINNKRNYSKYNRLAESKKLNFESDFFEF